MTTQPFISVDQACVQQWDVLIVGAGMGGGTAAYALATAGHKVLLIEKGLCQFQDSPQGVELEQTDPQERLDNGKWPQQLCAAVDGKTSHIWAPLGCGLGGSSLLYAAALQRLEPVDFGQQAHPQTGELRWPYSYDELEPYYEKAESLFSVRGSHDPLATKNSCALAAPPPMCERDQHYFQMFKDAGLHPYRLHVAMEYQPGCGECGGQICARQCKRDAFNSCILPGLNSGNLWIVGETEVETIEADAKHATHVTIKKDGHEFCIGAKVIVLSAGAYMSPVVLLRSKNNYWPDGLANTSGMVGRNLMFHASDFIAFYPRKKLSLVSAQIKPLPYEIFMSTRGKNTANFNPPV